MATYLVKWEERIEAATEQDAGLEAMEMVRRHAANEVYVFEVRKFARTPFAQKASGS